MMGILNDAIKVEVRARNRAQELKSNAKAGGKGQEDPPTVAAPGEKGDGKGKSKYKGSKGARKFSMTVDNKPLCCAWNDKTGRCTELQGACANGRVHACTNCRSPNHRACDMRCE